MEVVPILITAKGVKMAEDRDREAALLKNYYNAGKLRDPKLRQQKVADNLGCSQSIVAAWFNGHARCPDRSLIKLGDALGFDPKAVRPDISDNTVDSEPSEAAKRRLTRLFDNLDPGRVDQVTDFVRFILATRK